MMALGCTAIRTSGHVQRDLPRELEGAAALRAAGRAAGPQVAWRPRLAGAARRPIHLGRRRAKASPGHAHHRRTFHGWCRTTRRRPQGRCSRARGHKRLALPAYGVERRAPIARRRPRQPCGRGRRQRCWIGEPGPFEGARVGGGGWRCGWLCCGWLCCWWLCCWHLAPGGRVRGSDAISRGQRSVQGCGSNSSSLEQNCVPATLPRPRSGRGSR